MSRRFRIGYCTSGFGSHRLEDALGILAELGYEGIFLTLDVHHLDPFAPELAARVQRIARKLEELDLAVVVETGARYLLDPWRKHEPTLLSDDPGRRLTFLRLALGIARDLGAPALSMWSGRRPVGLAADEAWRRLLACMTQLLPQAESRGVSLAFEPEPGMLVSTLADYRRLGESLGHPARLGLSLDVGHLLANEEGDPAPLIRAAGPALLAVAVEDMRRGVHEHLPFGEGDLDLPGVIDALKDTGFSGIVAVELARHGHDAVRIARHSRAALEAAGVIFRPERLKPC